MAVFSACLKVRYCFSNPSLVLTGQLNFKRVASLFECLEMSDKIPGELTVVRFTSRCAFQKAQRRLKCPAKWSSGRSGSIVSHSEEQHRTLSHTGQHDKSTCDPTASVMNVD